MKQMRKTLTAVLLAVFICISAVGSAEAAAKAKGTWHSDENGWWYTYTNGTYPAGQWVEIDKLWYYFKADGYMDAGGYRDGCWLNSNGSWNTKYSGAHWASNATGWWYEDPSGWYPVSQWLQIDGDIYYFKDNGYMAANEWIGDYFVDENGKWVKDKVKKKYEGAWVDAYKDKINTFAAENPETEYGKIRFSLIYIDGDDTPELVCAKQGYFVTVYTYYNNEAKCIMDNWGYGASGNYGYDYGEKTGIVSNGNSDMAGSLHYTTYWKLENGELNNTEYYLCRALFDYKKYGFSWSHSEDMDYHYYKILSSSKGRVSDYEEISVDEYNSLKMSTESNISGSMTKDEIISELGN